MTDTCPCLIRVGDNVKKYRLIKLIGDQVTIGRSCEVTFAILSDMISRNHAVLKRQSNDSWTITDNKSLNGVYVNGKPLSPNVPHQLCEGDTVQFGVPSKPHAPAEFIYKYSVKNVTGGNKKIKLDIGVGNTVEQNIGVGNTVEQNSDSQDVEEDGPLRRKCARKERSSKTAAREVTEANEQDYKTKIKEMERLLREKEEQEKKVQEELENERKEKAEAVKRLQQQEDKQKQLDLEQEMIKKKIQEELEIQLKEREASLLLQLENEREALRKEKKQIEEDLSKENAKVLEEKNKELGEQLLKQKKKLEQIIEKKEMEQKLLESQLDNTKKESETAKLQVLQAREEVLSNFVNLMELELQCSICNELYIKATSLNCSHIYCTLCINQWMKVRKDCPICRKKITSQVQALALDSYIEKMVEQLGEEHRNRRKELIEQRKAEQDKFNGVKVGTSSGLQHSHATRASTRAHTSTAYPADTSANHPIVLSDSEQFSEDIEAAVHAFGDDDFEDNSDSNDRDEDDDDDRDEDRDEDHDDDSSESVDGEPGAYYGGYGHCYKCGARGHWARGCPF